MLPGISEAALAGPATVCSCSLNRLSTVRLGATLCPKSMLCMLRFNRALSQWQIATTSPFERMDGDGMANSQSEEAAVLLDAALQPAQVLQRIDHVICHFLSDLTACSLPLIELVRTTFRLSKQRLDRDFFCRAACHLWRPQWKRLQCHERPVY